MGAGGASLYELGVRSMRALQKALPGLNRTRTGLKGKKHF